MVDLRSPLNARQLAVLRWINDGCPDGVMQGHTHKTVALALQNRRLASVSKKGGSWRAELTDAGRHYLQLGTYPPGHASRAQPARATTHKSPPPPPAPATVTRSTTPATAIAPTSREELAEQLVKQMLAAGGTLEIDTREDRTDYELLIRAAKRARHCRSENSSASAERDNGGDR